MLLISTALLSLALAPDADVAVADGLRTVAERSGYKATARYDDVVALGKRLAESSKLVRINELGKTVEGRPIPRFGILAPCRAVTLLGLPAVAVCCGISIDGLPLAVQVVARPFAEREALAVALQLERHFGRWQPRE